MDLAAEQEDILERTLISHIEQLSGNNFTLPQAGMRHYTIREPVMNKAIRKSTQSVWVCAELEGSYNFQLDIKEGKHRGNAYSRGDELAKTSCQAIERAVEEVSIEHFSTMPDVEKEVRYTVRLKSASTLKGMTWADRLASIPNDATFKKEATEGSKTGAARDRRNGMYRGHEGRYADVERDVLIPATELHLLETPMWVARWTFESIVETFGAEPTRKDNPPSSIVLAVIPIADPLMDDLSRSRKPLYVPERQILKAVLAKFESSGALSPSLVMDAFHVASIWPEEGDWMVVNCRDDGTARYGIAPFALVADVTNPRDTCATILKEIKD